MRESLLIRRCNIQSLLIFDPFFFLPIETSGAGGGLFGQQTSTASGGGLFGGATTTPQQTTGGGGLFGSTAAGTGASSFLKPAGGAFGTAASTGSTGRFSYWLVEVAVFIVILVQFFIHKQLLW